MSFIGILGLVFGVMTPSTALSSINPDIQWNLIDVGAEEAWYYTQGRPEIIVAVIDSGVDLTHPDLKNQSWNNANEIQGNKLDDDNNGYVDDINGWDFRDNDNDPSPGHLHGTFVAGLLAADDDDDIIVGMAPNIRIMALRFLDNQNSFGGDDWDMFIEALDYAVDNGANIIHLSIQADGTPPESFHTAIKRAYENGAIIVSVTGNYKDEVTYPGKYTEVIAVSATTKERKIASFSSPGDQNEICAPGDKVYSIYPEELSPKMGSGTSFAAPLVSGTIALMLSINPSLSIETIRTVLHETCTDLGDPGKDPIYGYGLLNASAALHEIIGDPLIRTLNGHTSHVWNIDFAPNDQILASASTDLSIKIWDVLTGQCVKNLTAHTMPVYSIAFHPQGEMLASSSFDNTILLWNVTTGQLISNFTGHSNSVYSLAFSSNGKILASASADRSILLWNISTRQVLHNLTSHTDSVETVAFSPDNKLLASGSLDQTIKLWDINTGSLLHSLVNHSEGVVSVAFSPDGKTLASGSLDQTIKLWNVEKAQLIQTLVGHQDSVLAVIFNPDGKTLASSSNDTTIIIWDAEAGKLMGKIKAHNSSVMSLSYNTAGNILASCSTDNSIKLWNVTDIDFDGMLDSWERIYNLDPGYFKDRTDDPDKDNLINILEFQFGTNPKLEDTDGDLILDGYEFHNQLNGTLNDSADDTDADGLPNLYEYQNGLRAGYDDADGDPDEDGLSNLQEYLFGTNPRNADTDNDGWSDGIEKICGTDPRSFNSNPLTVVLLLLIIGFSIGISIVIFTKFRK